MICIAQLCANLKRCQSQEVSALVSWNRLRSALDTLLTKALRRLNEGFRPRDAGDLECLCRILKAVHETELTRRVLDEFRTHEPDAVERDTAQIQALLREARSADSQRADTAAREIRMAFNDLDRFWIAARHRAAHHDSLGRKWVCVQEPW